jgi:ankyrin repeat protein
MGLRSACEEGDVEEAARAIGVWRANGWSIDGIVADNHRALALACRSGSPEVLKVLIEAGCDIECQGCDQWTALFFAARSGNVDCVEALLAAGANREARALDGSTPLMLAAAAGHAAAVDRLVAAGCDMEAKDEKGMTPFLKAAQFGMLRSLGKLSEAGCRMDAMNFNGETAVDMALRGEGDTAANCAAYIVSLGEKKDLEVAATGQDSQGGKPASAMRL